MIDDDYLIGHPFSFSKEYKDICRMAVIMTKIMTLIWMKN